ncbi:hypothetical protein CsSME_00029395 [Camellia sinensis var. sinensis]
MVQPVWFVSNLGLHLRSISIPSLSYWFSSSHQGVLIQIVSILWAIWKMRNQLVFQSTYTSPTQIHLLSSELFASCSAAAKLFPTGGYSNSLVSSLLTQSRPHSSSCSNSSHSPFHLPFKSKLFCKQ